MELFFADYTVSCGRLKAWTADGTNVDARRLNLNMADSQVTAARPNGGRRCCARAWARLPNVRVANVQ